MDSVFDTCVLNEFNTRISAHDGVSVSDFQAELTDLFERNRSDNDLKNYRLSKSSWKKLADEVVPVSDFLRFREIESGQIRFPLNNHPPDAFLWLDNEKNAVGIEVTIALGTERFYLARELVETGQGRGFLGVPDDAPRTEFESRISRARIMYSTDQALSAVREGIYRCMLRKDNPKYAGFILLIQAPLRCLPRERWTAILGDLKDAAAGLPFSQVYVMSNPFEKPWGLQVK